MDNDRHKIWHSDRSPLEEQFCVFKIFKMAAKTRHKKWAVKIQHCPISSKFDMWVDSVSGRFGRLHILLLLLLFSSFSFFLSFFPWTMNMNLSMADLRNYWTEVHETWWSYRYMFLVGPKVFSFVVKGVSYILRGSKGVGVTIESYGKV